MGCRQKKTELWLKTSLTVLARFKERAMDISRWFGIKDNLKQGLQATQVKTLSYKITPPKQKGLEGQRGEIKANRALKIWCDRLMYQISKAGETPKIR